MPKAEIAVWHPSLSCTEIEDRVGISARIALTVGENRSPGSGVYKETYCRFDLGSLPRAKTERDLATLEKFRDLLSSSDFSVRGAVCIVYFTAAAGEAEVYLGEGAVKFLANLGVGVVFRPRRTSKAESNG